MARPCVLPAKSYCLQKQFPARIGLWFCRSFYSVLHLGTLLKFNTCLNVFLLMYLFQSESRKMHIFIRWPTLKDGLFEKKPWRIFQLILTPFLNLPVSWKNAHSLSSAYLFTCKVLEQRRIVYWTGKPRRLTFANHFCKQGWVHMRIEVLSWISFHWDFCFKRDYKIFPLYTTFCCNLL